MNAAISLTLSQAVIESGEKAVFERISLALSEQSDLDADEVAGLAVLGLRFLAYGSKHYAADGEQLNHAKILSARDLLRMHKSHMKRRNWWDIRRIDGAVSAFINLGVMPFEEGSSWHAESRLKLESGWSIGRDFRWVEPESISPAIWRKTAEASTRTEVI